MKLSGARRVTEALFPLGAVPMNGFPTWDVEQVRAGEAALAAKLGTKGGIISVDISAAIGDGEGRVRERSDWKPE